MRWRDLILAPREADASPPVVAKVLNSSLAVVVLVGLTTFSLVNLPYHWGWSLVWNYRVALWLGWITTVEITFISLITSTLGGFILALGQRTPFLPLRYFTKTLVEIVRCIPLLVLILLIWYGLGGVLRWRDDDRFIAGIFILTLFESAYISEIMRAGIESISRSQLESARAIGLTRIQTYRYVIIPQAVRQILPPLVGQLVSLIKDSSLLSIIAIAEFTQSAQEVNSNTYSTLETYLPLAVGYLLLTLPISLVSRGLERRFRYET